MIYSYTAMVLYTINNCKSAEIASNSTKDKTECDQMDTAKSIDGMLQMLHNVKYIISI